VHSAMPMAQAVRLCPDLIIVASNFAAYRAASQLVMERLHTLTPLVEQISIDEAFLDVTALGASGEALAAQLQATIHDELVLSCYARGMSTRDIEAHLLEVYGVTASRELVSNITDVVTDEIEIWRNRPVDEVYPEAYS